MRASLADWDGSVAHPRTIKEIATARPAERKLIKEPYSTCHAAETKRPGAFWQLGALWLNVSLGQAAIASLIAPAAGFFNRLVEILVSGGEQKDCLS